MLHLGIYTYAVLRGVKILEELFESLVSNVEEKSVQVEVDFTNSLLSVYVKQSKDVPRMAVHKLFFQMILF